MKTVNTSTAKAQNINRIEIIRALAARIEAEGKHDLQRPKLRAGQWMTAAFVALAPN